MADKIKKFFQRKKADAKFKLAGPGHKLTEESASKHSSGGHKQAAPSRHPGDVTQATRAAAEAALARLSTQRKDTTLNTSLRAIQAQVKRELEAESKNQANWEHKPPVETNMEASPHLAVRGVYFACSIISEEILTKDEWKAKIKEFLLEQLEEERGLTACLMIQSCNYNRAKVNDCVDVLCKYLENIIANPQETKYHKIRCSNNTFREKVMSMFGAFELLEGAGFTRQCLEHNGNIEDFFVFDEKNVNGIETLEFLRDALKAGDRIEIELDRNLQVLSPAQATSRVELPSDFFAMSAEELKREQQLRSESTERQMALRTKAMREKEELREIRKYKYALIRIRFPDGLYLQGTFSVYEKFAEIVNFVEENLEISQPFILSSPTGHKFEDSDKETNLMDLRLVPATILTFQWSSDDVQSSDSYLKPEVMILVQSV